MAKKAEPVVVNARSKRLSKKERILATIIVLVLLGVASGIYIDHIYQQNKTKTAETKAFNNGITKYQLLESDLKYNAALNELNSLKPLDTKQKFTVYELESFNYAMEGNPNQSLKDMLSANSTAPNLMTGQDLAQIAAVYQLQNNKTQAVNYYKQAIANIKQSPSIGDQPYEQVYQNNINQLEGSK